MLVCCAYVVSTTLEWSLMCSTSHICILYSTPEDEVINSENIYIVYAILRQRFGNVWQKGSYGNKGHPLS